MLQKPDEAASHGIAPRHVQVVAPALALMDYGAGQDTSEYDADGCPIITVTLLHAERAHMLVDIDQMIRNASRNAIADEDDDIPPAQRGHAGEAPLPQEPEFEDSHTTLVVFKRLLTTGPTFMNRSYLQSCDCFQRGEHWGREKL